MGRHHVSLAALLPRSAACFVLGLLVVGAHAQDRDQYEPDDRQELATPLPTDGTAQTHTAFPSGDVDWVQFDYVTGRRYTVSLTTPEGGSGGSMSVTGPTSGVRGKTPDYFYFTPEESGTAFLAIQGRPVYEIRVVDMEGDPGFDSFEPDDSRPLATPIPTDGTAQHLSI